MTKTYQVNGATWCGTSIPVPGYTHLRTIQSPIVINRRIPVLAERAKEKITEWLELCEKPSVSFSCGKDSIIILHLALSLKPGILVIRHSSAEPHLPDVRQMMAYWQNKGVNINNFIFGSLFEMYKKHGLEAPAIDREYKRQVEKYEKEQGIDGALRGIRAEESRERKNLRQYGKWLRKQNGIWVLDPILDWTAEDVWSYVARYGLPYCQLYDLDDGRDMNRRRLGSIWGTSAAQYGRIVWLKKYYPEYYQMFTKEFPEVRQYV
ncbi:MAG: phosphoadenosine phosphosulfate reductase family protein [Candidatus Syntrophopropionicum ammoniitolerans]